MWISLYKNFFSYFCPRRDSNPRTLQNISLLESGALASAATPSVKKIGSIIQSYSKYFWRLIIKEAGTRTHNHLGKKFCLVFVVLYMAYQFQVGEQSRNGFWWGFEVVFKRIYYYIRNFRVWKKNFPHAEKKFFFVFFFLIPLKTFSQDHN